MKNCYELEESRGMAVAQTKDPQIIKGQWIFSWYIRYQPMYIAMTKSFALSIFYVIKSYY